ncbi:PAS domain S-box-containing protein [Pustulibacterium marinum]|uniref:histidine kinase n=1 Tax=Pustulibacterium marinum TaxID=1224947 RepID=A0A1I7GCZ5_9FLAO|nr:ATP-binding protein [Pustulibacterium marinum]SFU46305.1 PAS domain S-box-containing protein [Pustulibacterium marinum]
MFKFTPEVDSYVDYVPKMLNEIEGYAIILLDIDGNIVNWNKGAERIKGYSAREIIGKNFRRFYPQRDLDFGKPDVILEKAHLEGRAEDEGYRVKKDGSLFWGSVTITAIHNDENVVTGYVKLTRDLTERKLAEEALINHTKEIEQKNKELEQYTYIASHDLQEPLRTVTNFVKLFEEEYQQQLDDTGMLYLDFISKATGRMSELVKGLLDYSRIGQKKNLEVVNCKELVLNIVDDLSELIEDNNAKILVDELPEIKAYSIELRLLFQNLISNAIKFRKPDIAPKIIISAQLKRDGWEFYVRDNGIGIEERYLDRIFVMFQRLHEREEYDGTGIGLAHCKKIVELHQGKISVISKIGKGSTFYFTLKPVE